MESYDRKSPKYLEYHQNINLIRRFFTTASNGIFHQDSASLSKGKISKVSRIDPGELNIWCAYILDEERQTLNLSHRENNKSIGLIANRKWIERKKTSNLSHQNVELDMAKHSLKEFDLVQYENNLTIHLN